MKSKLGVVLDHSKPLAWEYTLLKQILSMDTFKLEAIFYMTEKEDERSIWQLHLKLDQKYFKPQPNAFEKVTNLSLIEAVPKKVFNDLSSIESLDLDTLLWLSDQKMPENVCKYLSTGVLYFLHGVKMKTSFDFLGYWEFIKKQEVITSTMVFLNASKMQRQEVYQTWSMMPSMSISRSRNEHAWKLASLAFRALQIIGEKGVAALLFKESGRMQKVQDKSSENNLPNFLQSVLNLGKHLNRMAFKALRKIGYREQWILLLDQAQGASTEFDKFEKILPPKDRFWADPFLIEEKGKRFLFFEELPYATDKGHLSVMEIQDDGSLATPVTILDKPYHLSYPFIFKQDDIYYMIPESYQDRTIQLYECTSFPFQWEHKMNLMEKVSAFDTTLYFYNDKWWLFTVLTEHQGAGHNDELFLFFADTPFTNNWQAHPQNPIVSDVRRARPAGNIYEENGKLIRPSQDCARKYGFGFNLNEIEVLTETEYREKCLLNIRPDWDQTLTRTHSFNHSRGMTVIDAVTQRSRFF